MDNSNDMFFEKSEFKISDAAAQWLHRALEEAFPRTETGDIDWSLRPYAKKWYWPRRGFGGLKSLLNDLPLDGKSSVYLIRSDRDNVLELELAIVFRHLQSLWKKETSLLIVHRSGKWLIEIARDGYLYFDFSIPDEKEFHGLFGSCPMN